MRHLIVLLLSVGAVVSGYGHAQEPAAGVGESSKVWIGRHAEYEAFLKEADIVRMEPLAQGVTKPRRAWFAPDGLAARAIIKSIKPGRHDGYFDSYKSEVAAYELDRLLGLDMVPPTVERRLEGEKVSAQLWVERCARLSDKKDGASAPDINAWNRQVYRHRVFDNLIANLDRNAGNILIDPAWNIILIDHSRAFDATTGRMPFTLTRIDRELYGRLKALDKAMLTARVRPWIEFNVDFLLRRRDHIVRDFERLVKAYGEAAVFID
jgi:hypothetical protein